MDSPGERTDDRPAEIAALAERVFGNAESARQWLHTPNHALEHEAPSAMLHTATGADRVNAILIRIEHGVYE